MRKLLFLLSLVVLMVGCSVRVPAPVIDKSRVSSHAYIKSDDLCKANQPGEFCHVVEKGDTLYAISRRYGAKVVEIASRNNIVAPYVIKPGQRLIVRPQDSTESQVASKPASSNVSGNTSGRTTSRSTSNRSPSVSKTTPPASKPSSTPKRRWEAANPKATTTVSDLTLVTRRPHSGWQWPVAYQPLREQPSKTAWDYQLADGIEIVAATAGKVIYAGSGLNKYKHLVIIDTGSRYLLAYEFNSGHSMREGQQLNIGEVITRIEKPSGLQVDSVERYKQFHFEIWADGKPIDPSLVLGRVVAAN